MSNKIHGSVMLIPTDIELEIIFRKRKRWSREEFVEHFAAWCEKQKH